MAAPAARSGATWCGTRTAAAAAGELDTTSARALPPPFGDAFGDALRAPGLRLPADSGAAAAAATASASGEGGGEGEREPPPPEPPLLSARVSAVEVGGDIRTPA